MQRQRGAQLLGASTVLLVVTAFAGVRCAPFEDDGGRNGADSGGASEASATDGPASAGPDSGGDAAPTKLTVFVSGQVSMGRLGATDGGAAAYAWAKGVCTKEGAALGAGKKFEPGICVKTTADGPESHLVNRLGAKGEWFRVGAPSSAAVISDGAKLSFLAPVDKRANGGAAEAHVWTGCDAEGKHNGVTCEDWSTAAVGKFGEAGETFSPGAGALAWSTVPCDALYALYCFEVR